MKKIKLVLLPTLIAASFLSLNAAQAGSGTVGMSGDVSESACTVAQDYNANLAIPPIGIQDMNDSVDNGRLSSSEKIDVRIIDCPSSVTKIDLASATHDGTSTSDIHRVIPNGTATGITVAVAMNHNFVRLDGQAKALNIPVDPETSSATIKLDAAAFRNLDVPAAAGDFNANVVLTLSYS